METTNAPLTIEQAAGQKLLLSFAGKERLPAGLRRALRQMRPGGVTLFRSANIDHPAQVRRLSAALQRAAAEEGLPILLIAADQEGGQLTAIGEGTTPFPGNLALGAAASAELAYQVGYALGCELSAMGINVDYAPVCDVNINPDNPVIGTRSFGDDPAQVARLAAAQIRGLQAAGVAATAKHFPGHGDTAQDSHHGLPILPHDLERLKRVELPPFEAAIQAGVRLVMAAHLSAPALDGESGLPASLSARILQGLLRDGLGFEGVIVSDALDMGALYQGDGLALEVIAAVTAGVDLLLLNHPLPEQARVHARLLQACQRGLLARPFVLESARRILVLKAWLAQQERQPLETIGCARHQALALEVSRRSVTLVRDAAQRLPLGLPEDSRLAVITPQPKDLTPADTSSYLKPALAAEIGKFHPRVDEYLLPIDPTPQDISALRARAGEYAVVLIGTVNAANFPGQSELVNALLATGVPCITVALRMPYDLSAYPASATYACTYSLQAPSLRALAEALFGLQPWRGRLPVRLSAMLEAERTA